MLDKMRKILSPNKAAAPVAAIPPQNKLPVKQPWPPNRHVVVDASGTPLGFYSDAVHKTLPPKAIRITEDQYQQLYNSQFAEPDQRLKLINGELVPSKPPV